MAAFSAKQRGRFYGDLAKFVRSGFGFDKAAEAMLEQRGWPSEARTILTEVLGNLRRGCSIADAFEAAATQPGIELSELELRFIEAGEKGAQLERAFRHLEEGFLERDRLRAEIRRRLAYPLVLFHVALLFGAIAGALTAMMHPDATSVSASAALGRGLAIAGGVWLIAALGTLWLRRLWRRAAHSASADTTLSRLPVLGTAWRSLLLSRFAEVFAISLGAALRMSDCLRMACRAAGSGRFEIAAETDPPQLEQGGTLADQFRSRPDLYPTDFARSIENAEIVGRLDEDFERWSAYYREQTVESLERLSRRLPGIFYGCAVAVAAFVILRAGFLYLNAIQGWLDMGTF